MKASFQSAVPPSSSLDHDTKKKSTIAISHIKSHMNFCKISVAKMTYDEII